MAFPLKQKLHQRIHSEMHWYFKNILSKIWTGHIRDTLTKTYMSCALPNGKAKVFQNSIENIQVYTNEKLAQASTLCALCTLVT